MKQTFETLEFYKILSEIKTFSACSLGKHLIDQMSPFTDLEFLTLELEKTDEVMRLINAYGSVGLGGLRDISDAIRKAEMDGTLLPEQLMDIARHVDVCLSVMHYFEASQLETPLFKELVSGLVILSHLKSRIEYCIAPDFTIFDHASSELASIRRRIRQMENHIRQKMNTYLVSEKDYLTENIITSRNDRFVIPVKMGYQNKVRGIVHAQSSSHQTAYIEPEAIVLMNNELQALKSDEQHEIERILHEMSQMVKVDGFHLNDNLDILAQVDFLFSKAGYAYRYQCAKPSVVDEYTHFYLKNARHPLIDQKKVVANTLDLQAPKHTLLITGSNTGGKTVNLKTAGLLSLMALHGLLIPVDEAVIPFFDDIFVDLGDEQSIEQSLSTFSSHMSRLVHIADNVTNRSLVLIDEAGSGTDPQEGQSIAQAILEYLHEFKCMCIATTHYSGLKQYAKNEDYILLGSVAFDEEKFAPTYRLILGESGRSYALEISKRLGLSDKITKRAKEIKDSQQTQSDRLLERLETEIENARNLQEEYEAKVNEIKVLEEKYKRRQEVFDREKQRYLEKAQNDANELVDAAKLEVEELLRSFKEKGQQMKQHEINEVKHQLDSLKIEKAEEVLKGDPNYPYQVGDRVMVLTMKREAEIVEVKKSEVTVNMNGLRMQLKKTDIAYIGKKQKPKVVKTKGKTNVKKTGSYEINVIGMRYEEAMAVVDKFIDDALVTGYPSVRIIHGMGTGALRKGVHQLCKKHKRIVSFRDGGPNEGGLGATLAYFE